MSGLHERDYLERTIATVRNHRDADNYNCWVQWANVLADEIERLWADPLLPCGHRESDLTSGGSYTLRGCKR